MESKEPATMRLILIVLEFNEKENSCCSCYWNLSFILEL